MPNNIPLTEFDPTREAIIEPSKIIKPVPGIPERAVVCFFPEVFDKLVETGQAEQISVSKSEIGEHPFYKVEHKGQAFTLFHPTVGAAMAGALLEEAIAKGCRKFIACGGAGAIKVQMAVGHVVIPNAALRDEGLSYHYLPPTDRYAYPSEAAVQAIEAVLEQHQVPYVTGKTWTTDGVYRETPKKIAMRREEGCITVEMEAAAFFAIAEFREVTFGQLLYCGDDVSGSEWDSRRWDERYSTREKLFWLAAEACLRL